MKTELQHLIQLYQQNPCRLHACAIWKTLKNFKDYNIVVNKDSIRIWNETMVHLDFNKNKPSTISQYDLSKLKLLILHNEQMNEEFLNNFRKHEEYFRLQYDNSRFEEIIHDFHISQVNTNNELEEVASFIWQCYEDLKPSVDYFYRCTKESVFDPGLWIWVIDPATKKKVGLGIAEIDTLAGEGSLEWIQVFPDEQGKEIGKIIVNELIRRLQPRSNFITVAGKSKIAEKLYRKCGFTGDDIWHVLFK